MATSQEWQDYVNDVNTINAFGDCTRGIQVQFELAYFSKTLSCNGSIVYRNRQPGPGELSYRYGVYDTALVDGMGNEFQIHYASGINATWDYNNLVRDNPLRDELTGISCHPSLSRARAIYTAPGRAITCTLPGGCTSTGIAFSFGELIYSLRDKNNYIVPGTVCRSFDALASITEAEIDFSTVRIYANQSGCELSLNDWLSGRPPPPPEVSSGIKRKPKPRKDCDMCGCDCATIADINEAYFKKHVDLLNQQNKYINDRLNLVTDFTRQQIIAASPTDIDYQPIFDKIDDGVIRIWNGLRPLQQ